MCSRLDAIDLVSSRCGSRRLVRSGKPCPASQQRRFTRRQAPSLRYRNSPCSFNLPGQAPANRSPAWPPAPGYQDASPRRSSALSGHPSAQLSRQWHVLWCGFAVHDARTPQACANRFRKFSRISYHPSAFINIDCCSEPHHPSPPPAAGLSSYINGLSGCHVDISTFYPSHFPGTEGFAMRRSSKHDAAFPAIFQSLTSRISAECMPSMNRCFAGDGTQTGRLPEVTKALRIVQRLGLRFLCPCQVQCFQIPRLLACKVSFSALCAEHRPGGSLVPEPGIALLATASAPRKTSFSPPLTTATTLAPSTVSYPGAQFRLHRVTSSACCALHNFRLLPRALSFPMVTRLDNLRMAPSARLLCCKRNRLRRTPPPRSKTPLRLQLPPHSLTSACALLRCPLTRCRHSRFPFQTSDVYAYSPGAFGWRLEHYNISILQAR